LDLRFRDAPEHFEVVAGHSGRFQDTIGGSCGCCQLVKGLTVQLTGWDLSLKVSVDGCEEPRGFLLPFVRAVKH
jgi:hypothetical protein